MSIFIWVGIVVSFNGSGQVSSGKFLRDHKGKEVDWNSVPWV